MFEGGRSEGAEAAGHRLRRTRKSAHLRLSLGRSVRERSGLKRQIDCQIADRG
jgi:hypothetical protein